MTIIDSDDGIQLPEQSDQEGWAMCLASKVDAEFEHFPMAPKLIAKDQQSREKEMEDYAKECKVRFKEKVIEGQNLLTYNRRIVIPRSLQQRIISWYHLYLGHTGETRMEATLSQVYFWPGMSKDIKDM